MCAHRMHSRMHFAVSKPSVKQARAMSVPLHASCADTAAVEQVNVKHRGFKQMMKGDRIIRFANGDVIDFVQMPAYMTKGAHRACEMQQMDSQCTCSDLSAMTLHRCSSHRRAERLLCRLPNRTPSPNW